MLLPRRVTAVSALAAAALVALAAPAALAETDRHAAVTPPAGPTTVVALGDSAASGEGAGDYEPGTRGEAGNWCHRSAHAYVHRLGVTDGSVNLACSGARSADVALGGGGRYGEGSQAQRLGVLARQVRVTAVLLQVGGNDDPALVPTGIACIRAFLDPAVPGCRDTVGPAVARAARGDGPEGRGGRGRRARGDARRRVHRRRLHAGAGLLRGAGGPNA